ncbi:MAG: hypothetical protein ACTSQA_01105 [Candidatus Heimdallarchaeaceae archaeon]
MTIIITHNKEEVSVSCDGATVKLIVGKGYNYYSAQASLNYHDVKKLISALREVIREEEVEDWKDRAFYIPPLGL